MWVKLRLESPHGLLPAPWLDRPRLEVCDGVGPGLRIGAPVPGGSEADEPELHRFELQVYSQVGERWRLGVGRYTEYAGLCATQEARCIDDVRELFGKPRLLTVKRVAGLVLAKVPVSWRPFGLDPELLDRPWDEQSVAAALEALGEAPESAARSIALVREEFRYTRLVGFLEPTEIAWLIRQRLTRLPRFVDLATRVLACGADHSLDTAYAASHAFVWRDDNLATVMHAYRRWEFGELAAAVRQASCVGPESDAPDAAGTTTST